jgi:RNA polymerase sigma-70 factor (ECF subfamily)
VPDEVLARQAALGEKSAFAQLVARHGPSLYRYLFRLLRHHGDAEDCVQEVVLSAWQGLPAFRGDSSVRTWLFVLARHEAQKYLRRNKPSFPASGSRPVLGLDEVTQELRDLHADTAVDAVETALLAALDAVLLLLPERQRSVWILREFEGLSYAEIATVVGSTPTAVHGLLQRARAAVATALHEWR